MLNRIAAWWFDWQQSLWFLPAILTTVSTILALLMVQFDRALALSPDGHYVWAFGGGASGARGVLQAIAGSIITVTGTVFSITIVALQLASSQFSPRVLRTFTSDRGVQLVLGVFVGTFTYCLLVLRSVRSEQEDGTAFVPAVSVTVAVFLALMSIACLIFYIHHVSRSIQVTTVSKRVAHDTHSVIDRLVASDSGESDTRHDIDSQLASISAGDASASVTAERAGYLQRIDDTPLFDRSLNHPEMILLHHRVGEFVLPGTVLATVWPDSAATDERVEAIRASHVLGQERSLVEDVDFGLRQLADIAVKALSPGINDPTTACDCIDRLSELLARIVQSEPRRALYQQPDCQVSVIVMPQLVEQLLDTALTQIRIYSAGDVIVMTHLLDMLGRLAALARPIHRPTLVEHARLIVSTAKTHGHLAADVGRVEAAATWST